MHSDMDRAQRCARFTSQRDLTDFYGDSR